MSPSEGCYSSSWMSPIQKNEEDAGGGTRDFGARSIEQEADLYPSLPPTSSVCCLTAAGWKGVVT